MAKWFFGLFFLFLLLLPPFALSLSLTDGDSSTIRGLVTVENKGEKSWQRHLLGEHGNKCDVWGKKLANV